MANAVCLGKLFNICINAPLAPFTTPHIFGKTKDMKAFETPEAPRQTVKENAKDNARVAAALRANLAKRKQQQKARNSTTESPEKE